VKKVSLVLALIAGFVLPIVGESQASALANCPAGSNTYGTTQCIPAIATVTPLSVIQNYTCPSGGTLSGTMCVLTASSNFNATGTTNYYCTSGTLQGSSCLIAGVYGTPYQTPIVYSCSGSIAVLVGTQCRESVQSYTCPEGQSVSALSCYVFGIPSGYYVGKVLTTTYYYTSANQSGGNTVTPYTEAYSVFAQSYNSYSCPAGSTLSGSTCSTQASSYGASSAYTGFCPVNYTINTVTGLCGALAYTPGQITGPTIAVYNCSVFNQDGTFSNYFSPTDDTYSNIGGSVTCGYSSFAPVDVEKNYLCAESKTANGDLLYYLANTDLTSTTAKASIYCTYQGEYTDEEITDFGFFENLSENISVCAGNTWVAYLACLEVTFV
jgi:hypothetical protein